MRLSTIPLAVLALALASNLTTSRAEAQVMGSPFGTLPDPTGTQDPASHYTPYYYMPSYSYWTAAYYGFPPRVYSGYGSNDFPYYGRPYGSPSDPWSWPAMAGYPYGIPTRFNLYP